MSSLILHACHSRYEAFPHQHLNPQLQQRHARRAQPHIGGDQRQRGDLFAAGLQVVNREGVNRGEVKDLLSTGPQTVIVLEYPRTDTDKPGQVGERMIPFVSAYVDRVDLPSRRILVDWQPDY